MCMHTAIFTGGKQAPIPVIISFVHRIQVDTIIAADSGLQTVYDARLTPDYIIGDFDSLETPTLLQHYSRQCIKKYPCDKDFTDTELAMNIADSLGKETIIFGAGGTERLDHLLYFLSIFRKPNPPSLWVHDTGVCFCIGTGAAQNSLKLIMPAGTLVSVFSVDQNPASSATSTNLHWNISGVRWDRESSISNRADSENIEISVQKGRFLVTVQGHDVLLDFR